MDSFAVDKAGLSYTGINRHEGEDIGGWDTVIKREEYERLFYNQQVTMEAPKEVPTFTVVAPEPEKKIVAAAPVAAKPQPKPQPKPEEKKPNLVTATYGIKAPVAPAKPEVEGPKVEAFDYSKVQEGVVVVHKAFGEGKISWIDKARKYIRVQFSVGEKMFTMETAFVQGFLDLK